MEHALRSRDELIQALEDSREEELRELHRRHRPNRRASLLGSWLGAWLRAADRPVAEPLPEVHAGEVGLTFAGHASVLIRYAGLSIACDPMLGTRLGVIKRAVLPGLAPGELGEVRLALISHAHHDHLHVPTLETLPRSATIVVPEGCGRRVSAIGFANVIELARGQAVGLSGVEITATAVKHEMRGSDSASGYVIRGDGPTVFFCGDSGYFSGFSEIGKRHRPEIALLPIAGYVPSSFRDRHMSPLDAIYAFEDLGARMLVPIHHSAFALSYETLSEPLEWLRRLINERALDAYVTILPAGASRTFTGSPG